MKKITFVFLLLVGSYSFGQFNQDAPWVKELEKKKKSNTTAKSSQSQYSLNELSAAFNTYWKDRDYTKKGSGFKPYKRWESFWQYFVDEKGYLPTAQELWKTWENKNQSGLKSNPVSDWQALGPFTHLAEGARLPGQGRVNVIAVDPNDGNTWYIGAPAGGIWKSTNAGSSWTPLTDELPQIGVSGIAIDPNNSNTLYITTGDDDAGDSFSVGVFKSVDGGQTWQQTGLNPSNSPTSMNEIFIDPDDSNTLWVATNVGVFKTVDAGVTWEQKISEPLEANRNIKDLRLKPGNSDVIYAVTPNLFYKSTDGGENFSKVSIGLPSTSGRFALEVSPANPEYVYILSAKRSSDDYAFQGLYKSVDSGDSFSKTAETTDIFEIDQAWYDMALTVSPDNANEIYVGVLNIWKSTDGGDDFSRINNWSSKTASYTHADIHMLRFFNGKLYCGSDGGVYSSDDGGDSFTDHTAGLAISQFYRISVSPGANKVIGGLQDNGGHSYANNQWRNYHGGDGMDNVISPNDDALIYGFTQFGGSLNISSNSGESLIASVSAPSGVQGEWITPLSVDSNGDVFAAYNALYKLSGNSWQKISTTNFPGNANDLEIDPLNPAIMYVCVDDDLFKSENGGGTFTQVFEFPSKINSIEVNNSSNNIVYVTTAVEGQRGVFKSTDGGNAFENITFNLPTDQPYFISVHQGRHSQNPLYVGTNLGVYRLDDTANQWEEYLTGLPNSPVRDLDISLEQGIITAATYGRGVWQSPIPTETAAFDVGITSINAPGRNRVLCGGTIPEITVLNNGANDITEINIIYSINGTESEFNWAGTINQGNTTNIELPEIAPSFGKIDLQVQVGIPDDAYMDNNVLKTVFFVNGSGNLGDINSFESVANELVSFNENDASVSEWQRGIPSGNLLNTAASGTQVYGTNLSGDHNDLTKSYLVSKCYDFSTIENPVLKFKMAYELEENWDITYVEYSTDNGSNWSVLGSINSVPNWYNSNRTNAISGAADDCQNCPGAQWTGTNATFTEYAYDFEANATNGETDLTASDNIVFRIVFHSDPAVHEEGVIIDDLVIEGQPTNDDDRDGVPNEVDSCADTPVGTLVDVDGCPVFTLAADNFTIATSGESCAVSNNGTVNISANESYSYTGTLTGDNVNVSEDFTATAIYDKLAAGTYELCITLAEQPDYKQCFEIKIVQPDDLSVFSRVEDNGQSVTLSLTGSDMYFVEWNGAVFTTSESEISLPLSKSKNELRVSTEKNCQGEHFETITVSKEVLIYPNPVKNNKLNIQLGYSEEEVFISLYTISGKQIIAKKYPVQNGMVELQPERFAPGVYVLNINTQNELLSYKIIKR